MNFVGITSQSGLGHMPRGVLRVLWPPIFHSDIFNAPKDMRLKMAQRRVSLPLKPSFLFLNLSGTVRKKPAVPVEVCDFLGFLHGLMVSFILWWRRCLGWPWQRQWEPLWFWKRLSVLSDGVGVGMDLDMSMRIQGGLADVRFHPIFRVPTSHP